MNQRKSSAIAVSQLQVLLIGSDEHEFLRLRQFLSEACGDRILLEHALSESDALLYLKRSACDLVLCNYRSGDGKAVVLLRDIRCIAADLPLVFLSEHVDEIAIGRTIDAAISARLPTYRRHDHSLARALSAAISRYCRENQRQKSEEMLRKLWHAVEQTADLIVITDRAGIIEYVNPAFATLTGYSREEAVGQTFRLLKSNQQAPELYQDLWRTILAGQSFRGEILNQKKNGEVFAAEKTITPLRDTDGQITHFISTDRDITERHKLEAKLQQAHRMDAIGRLAGGVAHDFNNLLMVISSYAELVLDSITGQHPMRRNVEEIMAASARAADLTKQLLAFGRQQMQTLRVLDLNQVIQEISRMLVRLIGEDVQLEVLPSLRLGKVKADVVQIEQVLMNLAANARDAMPQGGKLTLETANVHLDDAYLQRHPMVPSGDYVRLTVADTGTGIAPEHLAHIFEPFYTTKPEGKGTGLGLATVYGIVRQSGGFIWVYGEPGLGTVFKIYLPQVPEKGDRPYIAPVVAELPRGCETLLLVEDEVSVRQSGKEFLEASRYTVLEANNGDDALQTARNYADTIHLMITDVVMPRLGGPKLAERLAGERPEMKVLFVSGYAENTVLQHGSIDMASQFLQKPFTLRSLAQKIRDVLSHENKARAAAAAN